MLKDDLEYCLHRKVPLLMNAHKIGLLVIDSIAAPYRMEDWKDQLQSRAKSLRSVGRQLHNLCKNDLCVICINQVKNIRTHCHIVTMYKVISISIFIVCLYIDVGLGDFR